MNSNQIINIPVGEVIPYDNNPRNNAEAVAYVRQSILKFGFRQPILIDEDNVIICGHTRLLAAKELGMAEVPCIKVDDLSEDEVKAFRLADNKVAEMSTWDWDKLEQELGAIDMSLLDFDMSDFGFDTGFIEEASGNGSDNNETDSKYSDNNETDHTKEVMSHQNEFKEYDEDIETEHKCPMCGYEW